MKHFILLALCACLANASVLHDLNDAIRNGEEEVVKSIISNHSEILNETISYDESPIHLAAEKNKLNIVKILLDKNPELINSKNKEGNTPLLSAYASTGDIIQYLISKGADVNAREHLYLGERTMLLKCVYFGKEQCVKLLIEAKADVNAKCMRGFTALHFVAADRMPNRRITELLIENGADVNAKIDNGTTPLFMTKNIDIAKILIDNCAVMTAKDGILETPLYYADIAKFLMDYKPDVNARINTKGPPCESFEEEDQEDIVRAMVANKSEILNEPILGNLPIHFAAAYNRENIVKILVENNPEIVNVTNFYGKTLLSLALEGNRGAEKLIEYLISKGADLNPNETSSLIYAAKIGFENVAKMLIENKADVNVKDKRGQTALHKSVENGYYSIAKLLIDNNAEVNVESNDSYASTPLVLAAKRGNENITNFLIDNGADVNLKTKYGISALHLAAYNGHTNIVKLLIDNSADVKALDNDGNSVLHYASMQGHKDVVAVLMENNANPKATNRYSDTPCDIIYYSGGRNEEIYNAIFASMNCTLPVFCNVCNRDIKW